MWTEKYRPKKINNIISHKYIIQTIKKMLNADRLPHLLFYGPSGTGKTTMALSIAKKINNTKYWKATTLELNASDERGINEVRERIKTFVSTQQMFRKSLKLVILDEADSMTNDAQFSLRRIIEQHTKSTRFIIICNYVNKIIPAIQSRCTKFRFSSLDPLAIKERLEIIARSERMNIEPKAVETIVYLSHGDMRKCLNILQATHMTYSKTTPTTVYLCTGIPSSSKIDLIWKILLESSYTSGLKLLKMILIKNGISLTDVLHLIQPKVLKSKLPPKPLMFLLYQLSELEFRLSETFSNTIQLSSFVGIFHIMKELLLKYSR